MSTRWYPIYQRGNPQLRVFLPNFWMKLVKPTYAQRKNVVQFHCSMEMTRVDVKNYLEKIYKVPVIHVSTRIALGKTRVNEVGYVVKGDDIKVAFVHLPRYESFTFPTLFDSEQKEKEKVKDQESYKEASKNISEAVAQADKTIPGIPPWFR